MTPKRVDANQPSIVEGLRAIGATVLHIHMVALNSPDIVVGHHGKNYLFEIKIEKGRLLAGQRRWHKLWRGQVAVIRSLEDALFIMGALADGS